MRLLPDAGIVKLKDVAREAGVSTATVDRVLHGRPGVRDATVRRVKDTIERLGFQPHAAAAELARGRRQRFCFVMPKTLNLFMADIVAQLSTIRSYLAARRALIDVIETDVFDAEALASTLEDFGPRYDGIAVVALDHPRVRVAIDELVEAGTVVVTLVSDVPSSRRAHYVGVDNIAAGRTAGTLIGRFLGNRTGKVAVIAGSLLLRDHAERLFGVQQVISSEYSGLTLLAPVEGRDDDAHNSALVNRLLTEYPDLVAIYNIGAGTTGIGNALIEAGRARDVVFIGHDVTPQTRRFLMVGVMDAVLSQSPGHEARSAARVLLALSRNEPIIAEQEQIGIDIVIRDNLP
ncbi:MAG: LacI family DNA-binding transcriptional regulator [Ancalomicrobiaceae bacterium]|nr:LacI family DNA-binding transcriptional regulator [Ancalomicrobiaceae bacterium]